MTKIISEKGNWVAQRTSARMKTSLFAGRITGIHCVGTGNIQLFGYREEGQ